jgi:preprotein translocase subunit SecB
MADKKPQAGSAGKQGSGEAAKPQGTGAPPIQIASQYVKDLSFENPNAPKSVQGGAPAPQVAVNVDVRTQQLGDNGYEVVLHIKGDAKTGDEQAFIVELSYGGVVMLAPNVPKEHVAPLLLIEAPRMLFPFARAVIAEATRDGGFPPMLVQPIDFTDLFRRQVEAMKAQQKTG